MAALTRLFRDSHLLRWFSSSAFNLQFKLLHNLVQYLISTSREDSNSFFFRIPAKRFQPRQSRPSTTCGFEDRKPRNYIVRICHMLHKDVMASFCNTD